MASSAVAANNTFTDQHLTIEFFATALRNGLLQTDVTVTDLRISAGSSAGDNFCSDIFRAHVTFHRNADAAPDSAAESLSLIVKAMPFQEERNLYLDGLDVFAKEVQMYTETLPRMSALLGGERLAAKIYYSQNGPVPLIVFEDLSISGFVTFADRMNGLDEAHSFLVAEKLARFHAASVRLAQMDANAMAAYSFGVLRPNAPPNAVKEALFAGGVKTVAELMGGWEGFEKIAAKFERLSVGFIGRLDRMYNGAEPRYRVLNHGDFWVNNMMFRYADVERKVPVDVCFIDYQVSVFDSPGNDLNVFLNTSPQNSVRQTRREQILERYFETFAQTLHKLGSTKTVTIDALLAEVRARELCGLQAAVGMLQTVLMDHERCEVALSFESFTDAESGRLLKRAMYGNARYEEAMRYIVRRFEEVGVLDDV